MTTAERLLAPSWSPARPGSTELVTGSTVLWCTASGRRRASTPAGSPPGSLRHSSPVSGDRLRPHPRHVSGTVLAHARLLSKVVPRLVLRLFTGPDLEADRVLACKLKRSSRDHRSAISPNPVQSSRLVSTSVALPVSSRLRKVLSTKRSRAVSPCRRTTILRDGITYMRHLPAPSAANISR